MRALYCGVSSLGVVQKAAAARFVRRTRVMSVLSGLGGDMVDAVYKSQPRVCCGSLGTRNERIVRVR